MSLAQEQHLTAIRMSDTELGEAIKKPTQNIAKQVGDAIAHEEEAKASRTKALVEFAENIAYYYEVKQRLLNPGYRSDVNGGKDRTILRSAVALPVFVRNAYVRSTSFERGRHPGSSLQWSS